MLTLREIHEEIEVAVAALDELVTEIRDAGYEAAVAENAYRVAEFRERFEALLLEFGDIHGPGCDVRVVGDWIMVVVIEGVGNDETETGFLTREGQRTHRSLGLLRLATLDLESDWRETPRYRDSGGGEAGDR